jgi:hypothetical protein
MVGVSETLFRVGFAGRETLSSREPRNAVFCESRNASAKRFRVATSLESRSAPFRVAWEEVRIRMC